MIKIKSLVFFTAILLFCLVAGEICIRIAEKFMLFPIGISQCELLWKGNRRWWGLATLDKGQQQSSHYLVSRDAQLFYEPNSWFYGFKSKLENGSFKNRIFVLGDSTTRLRPGSQDDVNYYPQQLESLLNKGASNQNIVVNCGIPGYATVQEVRFLEKKLLYYRPTLVIIGYCLNDKDVKHRIISRNGNYFCSDLASGVTFCPALPFYEDLYMHSELYKLINYYIVRICKTLKRPLSTFDLGAHNTVKALYRLKELSRIHNFKTLFVIFPRLIDPELDESHRQWIQAKLINLGFDFIDMKTAFERSGINGLKLAEDDWYHFNIAGNELIARSLYDYIDNNLKEAVNYGN